MPSIVNATTIAIVTSATAPIEFLAAEPAGRGFQIGSSANTRGAIRTASAAAYAQRLKK